MPTSLIAYIALFAAVIATSASIAAGICRPDLTDIDGLVAGTVVYAGVAACVVVLDIAVLAGTSRLLGGRLDEREITLVVLLLAIAIYGPLRNWLSSLVRRVLFGRRGDRYQVVSSLAARLEASGRIEDQLPEMTSAVADAFKMSYVGVEIFASDGGTRSATFGDRPTHVQELPLTYSSELVGRLTLPARGVRSMLSRRDQALLVDLVRRRPSPSAVRLWPPNCRSVASNWFMIARTTGGGSGVTCMTASARRWAGSRCGWMPPATHCRPIPNAAGC